MARVTKIFEFEAGHRLVHHKGKCSNLHGHSYKLEMTIVGEINEETGMILDFTELDFIKRAIDNYFDHSMILNTEDKGLMNYCIENDYKVFLMECEPTAENIAKEFCKMALDYLAPLREKINIVVAKVWETSKCSAEVAEVIYVEDK